MANDLEALARALLASSSGQKTGKSMEKLGALLKTEDGRRLLTLLAGSGADTLKAAAQCALSGDEAGARAAMMKLFSTREGAALAQKLAAVMNSGK